MGYVTYFCGIVKIIEKPFQKLISNQVVMTVVRAELPQSRNKQFLTLHLWGNLAQDIQNYYKLNDYILIEGYISTSTNKTIVYPGTKPNQIILTPLKMYPFAFQNS